MDGLSCQPLNYVHNWTSPTTIKRKDHHTCRNVLMPSHVHMSCWSCWTPYSLGQSWKRNCCRGFQLCISAQKKRWCQAQRHVVQPTLDDRLVRSWKVNGCFTFLRRITNSKVSIQRSFQNVNSLLRQAFPEGFMPPWRIQHEPHTCSETPLDVECTVRAKNTSIKPDRSDLMTRSEKQCEVNHSKSLLDESNHSDAARSSSIDSGNSDCESRTGTEVKSVSLDVLVWSNLKKETIGKVVLGLAKSHLGNLIWTLKQVRRSSVPDRYHRMS